MRERRLLYDIGKEQGKNWRDFLAMNQNPANQTKKTTGGEKRLRGKFNDLTGKRFGKLVAVSLCRKEKDYHSFWICKCDCGNTVNVAGKHLVTGHTKRCGCITVEQLKTNKPGIKHGQYQTKLYHIWEGMRQRCNNTECAAYSNYGGRGIAIYEEWNDFQNFRRWALSHGYQEGLSIDRIDNDGNYCPSNCQWLTISENASKADRRIA